jgi:hypothetical protein
MISGAAVIVIGAIMAVYGPTYRYARDGLAVLACGLLWVIVGALALGQAVY